MNVFRLLILSFTFLCCPASFGQSYQIPVYAVTSFRTAQSGTAVSNCIDGDDNTIYHSNWSVDAIPDTLNFYFNSIPSINKIEYTPRQSGTNGIWKQLDIYYSTRENPTVYIKANTSVITWAVNNGKKTFNFSQTVIHPYSIRFAVSDASYDGVNKNSSCAEIRFYSSEQFTLSDTCSITAVPTVAQATMLSISSGSASNYNSASENINKSYDNNLTTLYHSKYTNSTFPAIPITLTYNFSNTQQVDFLKYIPRGDGNSNGYFGKVNISYRTGTTGNYVSLMDYDFGQSGLATIVPFPSTISVRSIRITVYDGTNNFASCAEMQFFTKPVSSGALPYQDIFADNIYSILQSGITQSSIDTISSPFYKSLAQCLFNGTYDAKYRVQEYEAYPILQSIATQLKTSSYNSFENPTGIVFEAGSKAVLFVDQLSAGVSLCVRDFANESNPKDAQYPLQAGLNVIDIPDSGLAYISYYNNDTTLSPVKINIVSGKINGYFDQATSDNADWINLLSLGNYPKLDIKGKYVNLLYDKTALKTNTPFNGKDFISMYDSIIYTEYTMMGLAKYNKIPKNKMFGYTESSGGWFAGGLGAHFDLTWGTPNSTSPSGLDFWGVAHEFGHINQTRPGLRWTGTTEVTNNLYSTWVYYTMNRQNNKYTRLESELIAPNVNTSPIQGGRINATIDSTSIVGINMNNFADVFMKLVPFWQLELYYQAAGAARNAPTLELHTNSNGYTGIDYAHWYGIVSEKVRNTSESGLSDGQLIMNFVKNTCDAVEEDLTDFFTKTGFLKPMNNTVNDYTPANITITQTDIDNTVAYVKAKNYPTPVSPVINYISAHSVNAFKNKLLLEGTTGSGVTYNSTGQTLLIESNIWKNAVAFETYHNDSLMNVSIVGTGDVTAQTSTIQYPALATHVWAVGYDGTRILVYPAEQTLPVRFISIKAVANTSHQNTISWKLGYAYNVQNYDVEKSNDGVYFAQVGTTAVKDVLDYSYLDNNVASGKTYYRIKAVNLDGSRTYSPIAFVQQNESAAALVTYPNPFNNQVTVHYRNKQNISTIQLTNTSGQLIATQKATDAGLVTFNTAPLPDGVYFILFKNGNNIKETRKIIKQK